MRNRQIRWFMILGALLGVIIFAFLWQRPGKPPAICFLGYTNAPTGGGLAITVSRLAIFAVTNQSRVTIRRWGGVNPQFLTNPGPPLRPPYSWTINVGADAVLRPGQSELVLVPMDTHMIFTNQDNWRAVFFWRRESTVLTRLTDWANNSIWVPAIFHSSGSRVEPRPSEWIEQ